MTAPWQVDRRYHRPDQRHTAGLTWDDIAPTEADDAELKRSLRAQNKRYEAMYQLGRSSRRCPADADVWETAAWWQGRYDRNRHRQEVAWAWLCKTARAARKRSTKPRRRRGRTKARRRPRTRGRR